MIFVVSVLKANFLSRVLGVFNTFFVLILRRGCVLWGEGEVKQFESKYIDPFGHDLPDLLHSIPFSQVFIYTFCHLTRQEE